MNNSPTIKSIRWPIYVVAIVLTVIPAIGALWAIQGVLDSTIAVGLNPKVLTELDSAGSRLKELSKRDPEKRDAYRKEFEQLQETKGSYALIMDLAPTLWRSGLQMFGVVLIASLFAAVLLASWLNRRIIRTHERALKTMRSAQSRVHELESRESWKLFAQKLVHEVKNPLTPVQLLVGRLRARYLVSHPVPDPKFQQTLQETEQVVNEEIHKIMRWIEKFSNFARMPEPRVDQVNLKELIQGFIRQYDGCWPNLQFDFEGGALSDPLAKVDPVLLKQIFFNLAKNSSEAGGESKVQLKFALHSSAEPTLLKVLIADDGPGVPESARERLFQPYSSSKSQLEGMGLGLAIAKRICIDHGGDIKHVPEAPGCAFELTLPRAVVEEASLERES